MLLLATVGATYNSSQQENKLGPVLNKIQASKFRMAELHPPCKKLTILAPYLPATLSLETEALNAILKYKSDEQK